MLSADLDVDVIVDVDAHVNEHGDVSFGHGSHSGLSSVATLPKRATFTSRSPTNKR